MANVNKVIVRGRGLAAALLARAAHVELDWDTRRKCRFDAVDSTNRTHAVALPAGSTLAGGDVLVVDDGSLVSVKAARRPVLAVRRCSAHGAPRELLAAAYRLGRRHATLALHDDHLLLAPDPALRSMLEGMHLIVSDETAVFEPEGDVAATVTAHHGHAPQHLHDPHHEGCHGDAAAVPSAARPRR